MEEIIEIDDIAIHEVAKDYKEAIEKASKSLLEKGKITQKYIEMMVDSVKTLGPYMVLLPGFALAHSAPGEHVKENCLSLAVFDKGIDFGSDKGDVRVVMVLASTDGESHVGKLQKVATKLMDDDKFVDKLIDATNKQEIYDLLNK